jgi:hypothetical protein
VIFAFAAATVAIDCDAGFDYGPVASGFERESVLAVERSVKIQRAVDDCIRAIGHYRAIVDILMPDDVKIPAVPHC